MKLMSAEALSLCYHGYQEYRRTPPAGVERCSLSGAERKSLLVVVSLVSHRRREVATQSMTFQSILVEKSRQRGMRISDGTNRSHLTCDQNKLPNLHLLTPAHTCSHIQTSSMLTLLNQMLLADLRS